MTGDFRDAYPVAWQFHRNTSRWAHNALADPDADSQPDPPKEYLGAPSVTLPEPHWPGTTLAETVAERLSCRRFGPDALSLDDLSTVIAAAYGSGRRVVMGDMAFPERPVPSAGGLYPLELYAIVRRVDGLGPGVYHYATQAHVLEDLGWPAWPERRGQPVPGARHLGDLFLGQPYVGDAAAVIVLSAVLRRSLKKYGDRGYRYLLFEAGHVGQNLNLTAVALGLGTCNLGGFYDDELADLMGLDAAEEIPLYAVALGPPAARDRAEARTPEA